MAKQRIQVYADSKIKRRVEVAATKYDLPVTEYCLIAIEQQLADDELLDEAEATLSIVPELEEGFINSLEVLQQKMSIRRKGKPIDIGRMIDEMRAERDDEILGLH